MEPIGALRKLQEGNARFIANIRGVEAITIASVLTYYPTLTMSSASPGGINGANPLATVESTNAAVLVQPLSPQNFLRGFDAVPAAMFPVGSVPVSSATDSLFFSGGSSNALSISAAMAAMAGAKTISPGMRTTCRPCKFQDPVCTARFTVAMPVTTGNSAAPSPVLNSTSASPTSEARRR